MKVLHLISGGDTGGAKTHVVTLLKALSQNPAEKVSATVACFIEGAFYKEIAETDIPHVLFKQSIRYDMSVVFKIKKFIREKRFDIIHAHGARANFIVWCLRPFIKIPVVTTIHSDYKMDFTAGIYKRYFFTMLNTFALRFMDYFIAVSGSFAGMLAKRGFDPKNIYTVYNAVDFNENKKITPKGEFLQNFGIPDGKLYVGIIARHDRVKGVDVFIRAAAEILKKRGDCVFLLAGEGDETENLKKLADDLKIKNNIFFLGYIKDIDGFLNAVDINCITSHSETFTYALLEGATHKKATVSTAVGGIPDMIFDGETGLLAEAGNYEMIAEKIICLLDDPEKRNRLGGAFYDYVKKNYSKESLGARHVEIYEDILRRRGEAYKYFDCMLSGYYGFKNSGDDAILRSITEALRREKNNVRIAVLTQNKRETAAKHSVYAVNRLNFIKIIKTMRRTRLFISGGGSLIADNSSTRSLMYYASLTLLAKKIGLKIMYYASGVGPVTKKKNYKRAARALDAADTITLRDAESLAELKKIGANADNKSRFVTSDPALSILPAPEERANEILAEEKILHPNFFIASVREWKKSADCTAGLAAVINRAYDRHKAAPVFIAMQPQDRIIIRELAKLINAPVTIIRGEYGPSEIIAIIGRAKFTLSMRLHALVYSANANTPMIGIAYDPKVVSFMNSINSGDYTGVEFFDSDKINGIIDRIMSDQEAERTRVRTETERLIKSAGRDAAEAVRLMNL